MSGLRVAKFVMVVAHGRNQFQVHLDHRVSGVFFPSAGLAPGQYSRELQPRAGRYKRGNTEIPRAEGESLAEGSANEGVASPARREDFPHERGDADERITAQAGVSAGTLLPGMGVYVGERIYTA